VGGRATTGQRHAAHSCGSGPRHRVKSATPPRAAVRVSCCCGCAAPQPLLRLTSPTRLCACCCCCACCDTAAPARPTCVQASPPLRRGAGGGDGSCRRPQHGQALQALCRWGTLGGGGARTRRALRMQRVRVCCRVQGVVCAPGRGGGPQQSRVCV